MKFPLIVCSVAAICSVSLWAFGNLHAPRESMQTSFAASPDPGQLTSSPAFAAEKPTPRPLLVVDVEGAVLHPGLLRLGNGTRVADAVIAAGGATNAADLVALNRAEAISDGMEIVVPTRDEIVSARAKTKHRHVASVRHAKHGTHRRRHKRKEASDEPAAMLDLNAASVAELARLPGLNEMLAERIVALRNVAGKYDSLDDLLDLQGMTNARLQSISSRIKINV